MGYLKIWLHLVWITKNRDPMLTKETRHEVIEHIKSNAFAHNIYIDSINGYVDHIHCLVSMQATQSVDKIMQAIKGESSHWINQNKLFGNKFEWQNEYFAVSVSESNLNVVREYIKNQEEHHRKKSFKEEYSEFMKKYGFDKLQNNV